MTWIIKIPWTWIIKDDQNVSTGELVEELNDDDVIDYKKLYDEGSHTATHHNIILNSCYSIQENLNQIWVSLSFRDHSALTQLKSYRDRLEVAETDAAKYKNLYEQLAFERGKRTKIITNCCNDKIFS